MSVELSRGRNASLDREAVLPTDREATQSLTDLRVGVSWKVPGSVGDALELDVAALVLGGDGEVIDDRHFVFFNNKQSPDDAVRLVGPNDDDRAGVDIDLIALPSEAASIAVVLAIYDAEVREQSFEQVRSATLRVIDRSPGHEVTELASYVHDDHHGVETAVVLAEIYRAGDGWKVKAVGEGHATGLYGAAAQFGVTV